MLGFVYFQAMLIVSNIVIIVFTLVYGLRFLIETVKNEHRKSWHFLTLVVVIILGYEIFKMLKTFGVYSSDLLILMFEMGFNGMLLFVFVFQRDLLHRYSYIKIEKIPRQIGRRNRESSPKKSQKDTKNPDLP